MKKIIPLLFTGVLLGACQPAIQLQRLTGKPGPHVPQVQGSQVTFSILVPQATLVTIAGNFNGWNPEISPLTRDDQGIWTLKLQLKPGNKYYYKYVVDGFWLADPDNPDTVSDGSGGVNSIVTIPAAEVTNEK